MTEETTPAEQEQPAAEQEAPAPLQPQAEQEQPAAEQEQPGAEQEQPGAEQEQPGAEQEQPAVEQEQPAAEQEQPAAEQEAPAPEEPQAQQEQPPAEQPQGDQAAAPRKPRRQRGPQRERRPQPRRERGPLPINELRDAARAATEAYGTRALRDAFSLLAQKERQDLSNLVAGDEDHRPRARNIATGSLGAGRLGKAIAAQQIAMARVEDLWTFTLSKEQAAEKLARVRGARRRDERRAQRDAERSQRSDRVSRAELEAAQDGRVGAQIRIIGLEPEDKQEKQKDEEPKPKQGSSVLDRLGY